MPDQYATVVHRWFEEVWNQGREATIDELMSKDTIVHGLAGPDGAEIRGIAGFKPFYQQFRVAFPDIHVEIEDVLIEGDRIAVRCVVTATHSGPGVMAPPTGKATRFSGICIARVKDGQIAEAWNNFDFLSLYQQLGMKLS